jgi:hypothetical protein
LARQRSSRRPHGVDDKANAGPTCLEEEIANVRGSGFVPAEPGVGPDTAAESIAKTASD